MRRRGVSGVVKAGKGSPRRDERWLSSVWDKQSFERRQLRSTSGLAFKIVFPGMCTGGAGPDFHDAILALGDGSLLRGDVELHLESSGWRQHGHHRDPAYDRVLLHVVLEDDEPVHNSRGEPILTLELAGRLKPRSLDRGHLVPVATVSELGYSSPGGCVAEALPQASRVLTINESPAPFAVGALANAPGPSRGAVTPTKEVPTMAGTTAVPQPAVRVGLGREQLSYVVAPCQQALPRREPQALKVVIEKLALERFHGKQAIIEGELAVFEPEQVLYAGLLEALGYSRNRGPFRRLGQLAPLPAILCARTAEGITKLLLGVAGLSEGGSARMLALGLIGEPLLPSEWRVVGVRPDNLPGRRIEQFAAMLERLMPEGLVDELLAPLRDADSDNPKLRPKQAQRLRATWQEQLAEVGRQRADAMVVNVLLPFAAAYGQATCQFLLSEAAVQAFLAYAPEGANQVTSYMRRDILRSQAGAAKGAAGEQGLLHVWDRWCHQKVCVLCPLGSRGNQSLPHL